MKWKCLKEKYVLRSKWLHVRMDSVLLPNGCQVDDYYVIEKRDVALVCGVTSDNKILLKQEYRYPIDKVTLELPGGTFDEKEETPLEAAKREFLEETGYTAKTWREIGTFYDYPTKDANKVVVFFAENIEKISNQNLDDSEDINLSLFPFEKVIDLIMDGTINVSGSIATIFKVITMIKKTF